MSLSKPINPPTVARAVTTPISSGLVFSTAVPRTQVNQIHGTTQNNANGTGIPKQVSNVQVSIANAQTGATATVSVLYRRDPTDAAFSGVNVWVKGYQGNSQLVQVASGTGSPCTFVLNNTGETVSFTIQAFGNGGNAPLAQSPTSSGTLPKSTGGGFGTSTTTSSPTGLTMPVEFVVAGSGTSAVVVSKANELPHLVWASASSGSASAQPAFRKLVPADLPVANRFGMRVFTGGNTLFNQGVQSSSAIGTASSVTATSSEPYYLGLASSASAGSSAGVVEGTGSAYPLTLGCFLQYETRIQLPSTASIRVWIGLFDGTAGINVAALRADNPAQNMVAFRYSTAASDTKWQMYTATDATHFTAAGTGSTPDTNGHVFGITYDGTNVNFYIDRVLVGQQATNLPLTSQGLHFFAAIDNVGAANSKSINVAYSFVDTL